MKAYDPNRGPDAAEWLASDEGWRDAAVAEYHRRKKARLPNAVLHGTAHVVVENQIAMGEAVVVDALARLQTEGLGRHDAVHAIGSVLMGQIYEVLKNPRRTKGVDLNRAYLDGVRKPLPPVGSTPASADATRGLAGYRSCPDGHWAIIMSF